MSEEKKQAQRIQTSLLNPYEKKVLVWLAERMPSWVTSDLLTVVGFLGAIIMAAGYGLSNLDLRWLWLSCFGLVVNWFGDSLDGSLARVRNAQRKTYGFFIDHNVDVINETIMFIGVGFSPLVDMSIAMFALVAYFMISVYVYIDCHLKGEMRLTYGGLGPTEFRLALFIVNVCFIYIPWLTKWKQTFWLFNREFNVGLFDYIGILAAIVLIALYLVSFFRDLKYFSEIDPPKGQDK
ncbi:MAG: CDP-alcohol phosphatidyltransferase family protein [Bacteroidales bacterium]|nr:CDP-alcohol phosphatidyltransferase family protein [Bacteroidales bacterium]